MIYVTKYSSLRKVHWGETLTNDMSKTSKGKYPDHKLIKNIENRVSFSRKDFKFLVESIIIIISGDIDELGVDHSNKLTGIRYKLAEQLCKKFDCNILVQFKDEQLSWEQELANQWLACNHYNFRCKAQWTPVQEKRKESKSKPKLNKRESSEEEEDTMLEKQIISKSRRMLYAQHLDRLCEMDQQSILE